MDTKILEVRDRATLIPMLCVDMNASNQEQRYLLRRAGYACDFQPIIMMSHAGGGMADYDPYNWGTSRTMHAAHSYIQEHWHTLNDGDVIDVEYILGETKEKKTSEKSSELEPWE